PWAGCKSRNPMVSFADAPGAPATRGRERLARPIDPDPGHGSSRGRYTTDVGAWACQSLSDGEKFPPAGHRYPTGPDRCAAPRGEFSRASAARLELEKVCRMRGL